MSINTTLDKLLLIGFSVVILSVGFIGWIPLMLVLQYFSTAYLLYSFVVKILMRIPYLEIIYLELIIWFPIVDMVMKTINPFYN